MANTLKGKIDDFLNSNGAAINEVYDSTSTVSNRDGNILERTEFVMDLMNSIDALVDAIKAKTDNLPVDPADQSDLDGKLGITTQFASDKTLLGYQNSLYQHVHQQSRVYPTLADGIVVTGGAGAWQLGNFAEIIPENTIADAYDIHFVRFESASVNDVYEFVLYKGALGAEVEVGRVRTTRDSATSGITDVPIQIPAQPANTRISAKVASKTGGGDTVTVSVMYHTYE